uniref:C2H2-type domain-containing protein n=1 Tax=Panagrolaimus sp. JU765 TaxID=591449 RepID=A0AC34QD68_9BILA
MHISNNAQFLANLMPQRLFLPNNAAFGMTSDPFMFSYSKMDPVQFQHFNESQTLIDQQQKLVSELLRIAIQQAAASSTPKSVDSTESTPSLMPSPSPLKPVESVKMYKRPHKCDDCGKKFRFHSNLVEHRTVHFDGNEHFFSCPHCPKKCRLKGNLKKHLHRHYNTQLEVDQAWQSLYGGHTRRRIQRVDSYLSV